MKVIFTGIPQDELQEFWKPNGSPLDYQKMENPFENFTYGKQYVVNAYWSAYVESKSKLAIKVQCDTGKMIWVRSDFFVSLEDWRQNQLNKTLK
jgi:hypothetical protein